MHSICMEPVGRVVTSSSNLCARLYSRDLDLLTHTASCVKPDVSHLQVDWLGKQSPRPIRAIYRTARKSLRADCNHKTRMSLTAKTLGVAAIVVEQQNKGLRLSTGAAMVVY